jgi:hypothetical protein
MLAESPYAVKSRVESRTSVTGRLRIRAFPEDDLASGSAASFGRCRSFSDRGNDEEPLMKTVLIEYTLDPAASVPDVERHIRAFVAGIHALGVGIRYASHRQADKPDSYTHIGFIPDDAALRTLQESAFFKEFGSYLPGQCLEKPRATWIEPVAATANFP